jgi:DNA replication protein DnaC
MSTIQEILARMPKPPDGVVSTLPKPPTNCVPNCQVCGGLGVIRYDVPVDHDLFGVTDPCPNQPRRNTITHSGLYLSDLDSCAWDNIKPEPVTVTYKGKPYQMTAKILADRVQAYISSGHGMVYLFAGYGQAKTLILKSATAEAVKQNKSARYIQAAEILDMLRSDFRRDNLRPETMTREVGRLLNSSLLAIDEFDKFNQTEWAGVEMFRLLDRRYEQAMHQQSVTLIAANKRPEDIDPAIASRIQDGRALYLKIEGQDRRPSQTW